MADSGRHWEPGDKLATNLPIATGKGLTNADGSLIVGPRSGGWGVTATTDDLVITYGDGTYSQDLLWYGNIPTALWGFDASASLLYTSGPIRAQGVLTALSPRFELRWVAGQRGKPGLNADIQNAAEAVRMIADPDFELLGTNAVSSCSAFSADGGIVLTTTTTSADQVILVPHLDTSQSAWGSTSWKTDQQTVWECDIQTPGTITTMTIWAGLKLTNTSTTATDDDQVFFRFQPSVNSGKWQAIYSIAGTDTATDSGVAVAATTRYHLKVTIDASRIARMYLNGALVVTSAALTATTLIPYIGVETGTAGARSLRLVGQSISRAVL